MEPHNRLVNRPNMQLENCVVESSLVKYARERESVPDISDRGISRRIVDCDSAQEVTAAVLPTEFILSKGPKRQDYFRLEPDEPNGKAETWSLVERSYRSTSVCRNLLTLLPLILPTCRTREILAKLLRRQRKDSTMMMTQPLSGR